MPNPIAPSPCLPRLLGAALLLFSLAGRSAEPDAASHPAPPPAPTAISAPGGPAVSASGSTARDASGPSTGTSGSPATPKPSSECQQQDPGRRDHDAALRPGDLKTLLSVLCSVVFALAAAWPLLGLGHRMNRGERIAVTTHWGGLGGGLGGWELSPALVHLMGTCGALGGLVWALEWGFRPDPSEQQKAVSPRAEQHSPAPAGKPAEAKPTAGPEK
jgi:hypothetical protein